MTLQILVNTCLPQNMLQICWNSVTWVLRYISVVSVAPLMGQAALMGLFPNMYWRYLPIFMNGRQIVKWLWPIYSWVPPFTKTFWLMAAMFFWPILLIYNRNVCVSVPWSCVANLVLIDEDMKSINFTVVHNMQVWKKSITAPLCSKRLFLRVNWAVRVCAKFQVSWTYGMRGVVSLKLSFWV